jgi:hypothetical protein
MDAPVKPQGINDLFVNGVLTVCVIVEDEPDSAEFCESETEE